ncbi:MAG: RagB/SusD family nutrient uptake outer membrane protein [Bacteroidaceae bacterium]|nr:RagB/SusD family nutrient uptake outer membrane protein [Bacteroidaceae bacterium]
MIIGEIPEKPEDVTQPDSIKNDSIENDTINDSERDQYEVAQDTLYSYWNILKSLQNVAERYVILGECRGDLVSSTDYVSDTIAAIVNFGQNGTAAKYKDGACKYLKASDYYHIINSCNPYIAHCDTFLTTGTNQKYMIKEYAQVQAIRAWTYMQLVQVYGEVPFCTKPLLNTEEMDELWESNYPTANAGNLVDLLAPELINIESVEKIYGFPQYNNYGRTSAVCHSSLCMFPVSVVLGDLYLMEGSASSCAKAAQHYYNYLNTENGGPLLPSTYCTGNLTEHNPLPIYSHNGPIPYTSKGKVSASNEAITCIPSSTISLWGTVLTDINRLFGFGAEINVSPYETGDKEDGQSVATETSVKLIRIDTPELVASAGYNTLCNKQNYEIYIVDNVNPNQTILKIMDGVGDARQYWNNPYSESDEIDKLKSTRYVTKQNPGTNFTTVYPMVYRKTGVWLRFAEAINRAGYPSYAFAVLKNGLCYNDNWYPDIDKDYAVDMNYTNDSCTQICYYLDKREVIKSKGIDYMNFMTRYFRSSNKSVMYDIKKELYSECISHVSYPINPTENNYITTGVHARGGGRLKYDDRNGCYNYVAQVCNKIKENTGLEITKDDIYSGNYDAEVQDAVEDLIIDECALELAFEGSRFFDLMRVARRRGNDYLARRVAKRNGTEDVAMRSFLQNSKNWYLPAP